MISRRAIHTCLLGTTLILLMTTLDATAHEGHEHEEATPVIDSDGPKRLPDGSVFLPKPSQRQLAIRTMATTSGQYPKTLSLNGRVAMDPNAGGKVQAMVSGRLTPGPGGLPYPGQAVKKGSLLAYVTPEIGGKNRSLSESRLHRLRELADTVPRKVIEEAEAAVANERLVAPVSGIIASASAVSGQVVEARETLFEIIDPARMLVEATSYEPMEAADIAHAEAAAAGHTLPLRLIGTTRSLRDQALPLIFRIDDKARPPGQAISPPLALGQPLRVFVQKRQQISGLSIPASALVRNPANQAIVWVKTAPERFSPRVITSEVLDAQTLVITSGLAAGDRVIVQGAALVNQIR